MDKTNFLNQLLEVLKTIPEGITFAKDNEKVASVLLSDGQSLLNISSADIQIPGVAIPFFEKPSPLSDDFVEIIQMKEFFQYLTTNNLFQRLNHLGFCYFVESARLEKERLINEIKKTKLHLYEETSNDSSVWLFVGDRDNWQSPMIELVLSERTTDKWKDYWLPHFQIDIDTYLNGDEIEKLILDNFKGKIKPYRIIETKDFIVLVRARLGIVSGININLDLGFEGRMTRYHRIKLLNQLA